MGQAIRILHLEDDSNDAELAQNALSEEGVACDILVTGNREAFAAALERGGYDLIIADYNLPDFDGLTALGMVRKKFPDIPFLFLSGTMGEDIAIESLRNGATDYVLKHRISRFVPAVRRALKEQEERLARGQAEKALRESEARYKALFDNSIDAILLTIPDGRILAANHEACHIFSRSEEEICRIGRNGLVDTTDPRLQAALAERERTGKFKGELSFLRKDGSSFPCEISSALFKDQDGNEMSSMIIHDITEQRALENQLRHAQKMDAISTLAGGIAHDFNNLLTTIIGFGTLLEMKMPSDDPLRKNASHILSAADRAASLTKSLLTFSREQPLDTKVVDLNLVIRNVDKLLPQVLREDIDRRLMLTAEELPIFADPGQLDQILLNLATNARDAMPNGGELTISTMPMSLDQQFINAHGFGAIGNYAVLSVTDTGTGMDEATRQRIFEPFFTTKEIGKGTGLGLSIIFGIVKQHDGFITCYSEPNEGTTFNIYLPLHQGKIDQEKMDGAIQPAGGTETILLAEDDDMVRNLARIILESAGYRVVEAVNGSNAVQQYMDHRHDIALLVLDLIMPRKNGRDAYNAIREENPGIRVIFTSGYSADVANLQELAAEGYDFIAKPLQPADLLKKVREVLDRAD